jgi:hypothetical protein
MPIDDTVLSKYISDVAGDDQELATTLRERLLKNEKAATNFVGGFTRTQDYTQKTQSLARDRQQFEQLQTQYEERLGQAEADKNQIMRDLASARISGSKAQELLKTVQQAYGLTANDLPGLDDIQQTQQTGRVVDSTPDLDKRFETFEQNLMKKINSALIPEISAMAMLSPIWNGIEYDHQQLFGKRLSKAEQAEILQTSRNENRSLESVWTDKYKVSDRRLEVRDEENKKKWHGEWEDQQQKKNQEAALRGVNPDSREYALEDRQSPIFKHNFQRRDETPVTEPVAPGVNPPTPPRNDAQRERMGGAERAAAKFMERARSGQLGKPIPERKTA